MHLAKLFNRITTPKFHNLFKKCLLTSFFKKRLLTNFFKKSLIKNFFKKSLIKNANLLVKGLIENSGSGVITTLSKKA